MDLSAEFVRNVRTGLGEAGGAWLRALPALMNDLARRWSFDPGPPFELSFNYVAAVTLADGSEAVLKIGPWEDGEIEREMDALRLYDGVGACRLLAADAVRRAMLLERVRPGAMLRDVAATDDDAATRIGAEVMRRLWRPVVEPAARARFKPLGEWFERAFRLHRATYGGPGAFPARALERAEALAVDLLASSPAEVLLHGDFHHDNVLSAEREPWLVIDPKGMLGDPGYEVGPFLLNPDPHTTSQPRARLLRRLDIFAEMLEYDRARLRNWAIAHAVLSACWSAEHPEGQGGGWQAAIAAAEALIGG